MSWITSRSLPETLEILGTLSETCARLGGEQARLVNNLVRSSSFAELVSYSVDYDSFDTLDDAIYTRQILAFYQKMDSLPLGVDRSLQAFESFVASELACRETNRTLSYHRRKPSLVPPSVASVLHCAQRKISGILGALPPLSELQPEFGPGANTNVKATRACPRAKLSVALECSYDMIPSVQDFLMEVPAWAAAFAISESENSWVVPVAVAEGKLMFVPKNAKTDRSIVIEPILNAFFQKGYGCYIRNRLARFGVNLRDQSRNQSLACVGSMDGSLATVDLSAASDSISYELVWSLLPYDWAERLSQLRTRYVSLPLGLQNPLLRVRSGDGRGTPFVRNVIELEKFSSMGNGFTFELESLLFYAIACGVCTSLHLPTCDVSVYGDDIIIPSAAYSRLHEVLSYCGFTVNQTKSFSDGPFRESCGSDYHKGFDIRPFYQKSLVSDRSLYTMHNWFMRHGERELALIAESFIKGEKLRGPDGYGDGHLIGSFRLRTNRLIKRSQWCGGYFDSFTLKPARFCGPLPGDSVLPVYSVYTRSGEADATDPDIVRGSRGYAKISIYTLSDRIFRA